MNDNRYRLLKRVFCLLFTVLAVKSFAMDLLKTSESCDLNVKFGKIMPHNITGEGVVFVSTYNLAPPLMFTILVHLQNYGDREQYIVFQNPHFDLEKKKGEDGYSPYTIRSHPVIHPYGTGNIDVSIALSDAENISLDDGTPFTVTINNTNKEVNTHHVGDILTFSPNNMHLGGLPERSLVENEVFSFISHIDSSDKKIDTLHVLIGDIGTFCNLAKAPDVLFFGDFVRLLEEICPKTSPHLAKIKRFLAP